MAKFDNDGNQLWIEKFGTAELDDSYFVTIELDSKGNVFAGGVTLLYSPLRIALVLLRLEENILVSSVDIEERPCGGFLDLGTREDIA